MWIHGINSKADTDASLKHSFYEMDATMTTRTYDFVKYVQIHREEELNAIVTTMAAGGGTPSIQFTKELTLYIICFTLIVQRPELMSAFVEQEQGRGDCRSAGLRAMCAEYYRILVVYNGLYIRFLQDCSEADDAGRLISLRASMRVLKRLVNGRRRVSDTGPLDSDFTHDGASGAGFICAASGCSAHTKEPLVCSGCSNAHYCGARCQKTHWKATHKRECKYAVSFPDKLYDGVSAEK